MASLPSPKIMVLGIGNTLLQDEGAGVHAMRQLQLESADLAGVEFMDGGTLSFTLAGPISAVDCLLVIDAAELGGPPGAVEVFSGAEMDRFLGANRKRSVHEVGLLDLLAVTCLTDNLPPQRALIGIQPAVLDWGEFPSAVVMEALPTACARAREQILAWRKGEDDER
ncbi:MAG: HyaD/HybD family hydrogenase maturation endopeptidase [Sulfurimicrobium sp.]|nr:HyaD/HybD family hydrogenase maturation endopeptidase [Sulfurimicrobium sp.]